MISTQTYMSRLYREDLVKHIRNVLADDPLLGDMKICNAIRAKGIPCQIHVIGETRKQYGIPNLWIRLREHRQAAQDFVAGQPLEV